MNPRLEGIVLSKFKTHSITKTNELFYAAAFVTTNRLGVKIDKVARRKEPMWKRRLQNKVKELRKDLSQLEASKDKGISLHERVRLQLKECLDSGFVSSWLTRGRTSLLSQV